MIVEYLPESRLARVKYLLECRLVRVEYLPAHRLARVEYLHERRLARVEYLPERRLARVQTPADLTRINPILYVTTCDFKNITSSSVEESIGTNTLKRVLSLPVHNGLVWWTNS